MESKSNKITFFLMKTRNEFKNKNKSYFIHLGNWLQFSVRQSLPINGAKILDQNFIAFRTLIEKSIHRIAKSHFTSAKWDLAEDSLGIWDHDYKALIQESRSWTVDFSASNFPFDRFVFIKLGYRIGSDTRKKYILVKT